MMSKLRTIAYVFLFVGFIITAVDQMSFDQGFYQRFYTQNNTAQDIGISEEDLWKATTELLDYTRGKIDDLDVMVTVANQSVPMFNQREVDHMVDVVELYSRAIFIRNLLVILFLLVIIVDIIVNKKAMIKKQWMAAQKATVLLLIVITGISAIAYFDFYSFWTVFHQILFSNDLWLLNPATDRLIMMVPLPFFIALVTRVIIRSITLIGLTAVITAILARKSKRSV